ncbi:unnamed protein product, partial [Aureobasidium pullulans]
RMNRLSAITETLVSRSDESHAAHVSSIALGAAVVCTVWYAAVSLVCAVGYTQVRHYSRPPPKPQVSDSDAPHVTIIRPVKGLEPSLYQCLESTFLQEYPKHKLTVFLCGDVIWIIDCNVWVNRGACGRMVDTLIGNRGIKNKFVHLLPLVVDIAGTPVPESAQGLLEGHDPDNNFRVVSTSTAGHQLRASDSASLDVLSEGGGRIEELFMSSAHAKFYTAINTVLIAPCIVGKSTMFRKSHLNSLTGGQGIDYFSENICEDHLIGDLLWKGKIPEEERGEKWGKHAQVFGDLAIQPMAGMSVAEYIARRSRWLRVRKFTVTLATFVEPGTEAFLCSLYGAFAFTTLPFFHNKLGVPQTWTAFALFWMFSVCMWCYVDWTLYCKLHSCASVQVDENTPAFARPPKDGKRRPFHVWLFAWLARETLALPIWTWAVYGGVTVVWRGKKLWVGMDMKVHEIKSDNTSATSTIDASKARTD